MSYGFRQLDKNTWQVLGVRINPVTGRYITGPNKRFFDAVQAAKDAAPEREEAMSTEADPTIPVEPPPYTKWVFVRNEAQRKLNVGKLALVAVDDHTRTYVEAYPNTYEDVREASEALVAGYAAREAAEDKYITFLRNLDAVNKKAIATERQVGD